MPIAISCIVVLLFPIKETFFTNPKNPYARTKLKAEKLIFKTFKKSKTNFIVFRFFTVYGPFGRPDMFIHKFLNAIKNNKEIKLYNVKRTLIFILKNA